MASVTAGGTRKDTPNDTHNNSGLDPSTLGSLTISHILLPVVCAVFISLVVVVIACCLIQRKPKSAGKRRKKSCHTIETSHETSDIGVYDVIDEMNVSTCTPEKTARHCTKLDSNCILGSHLLRHSKIDNTLPAAMTPTNSSFQAAPNLLVGPLRYPPQPRMVALGTGQISAYEQKSPDYLEEVNQEERVYETLDRHSLFRNEDIDHTKLRSIDRSLSFYHRDMKNVSRESLQSHNMYETLNRKPESEKSYSLCSCQKDKHFKDVRQDLRPNKPSLQAEESNKIVCQLSMFKVSSTQEKTTLIDKAYYRVQSQTTPYICASSEDISNMFHNRNLRLAHRGFRENSPDCAIDHDLILKPVCDAGGYINNLRESNTFASNLQKILMSQQKPILANSQKPHDFLDKRYENLNVSNSDLFTSSIPGNHINHSRGYNMATSFNCSELQPKLSDFTSRLEASRISAKLGPLPPLPAQYTILNEMPKTHQSLQQSKDTTFGCPQTKCTTSLVTPQIENSMWNQHVISRCVCPLFETDHEKQPKATILNKEVDSITCRVHSANNRCGSHLRQPSIDIPCTIGTRSMDDNTRADSLKENSNIYFILEPTSDVSGLNSDIEDSADCQLRRNPNLS